MSEYLQSEFPATGLFQKLGYTYFDAKSEMYEVAFVPVSILLSMEVQDLDLSLSMMYNHTSKTMMTSGGSVWQEQK